ncbi:MAG: D-alanyl-D-alanine carboxypeptidase/D-alanyl-D-alanine-endopeptidase [Acaryochloridaceae cyanobacterium SU_2_1]|nr:D-alanyl-D-alanine carboxypeptidase/D-alanyl-D-alanine-endopeptidase [Acaryochloridaceae cyanobacterium SU_2_1]
MLLKSGWQRVWVGAALYGLGLIVLGSLEPAAAASPESCVTKLAEEVDAIARQPHLRNARLGISLYQMRPEGPKLLYQKEGQQYFLPASTVKVLTTAVALTRLGPQYRFLTPVYTLGTGPTLKRLRIVGQGDPSLSDRQLEEVAAQLQRQGVRQIDQLVAEDPHPAEAALVPSWEWEDLQAGYGAIANGLILNQNAYELKLWPQKQGQPLRVEWLSPQPIGPWRLLNRTQTVAADAPEFIAIKRRVKDSWLEIEVTGQLRQDALPDRSAVAVIDPGWFLLHRWRAILAQYQIKVAQVTLRSAEQDRSTAPETVLTEQLLTQIKSPPLIELIATINQDSNNLYAEALLHRLADGAETQPTSPVGEQGLRVLRQTLTQLGVDPNSYHLVDGSGLSRHNLVSPVALGQTLAGMLPTKYANLFQASLPEKRLEGSPTSSLLSKTGSMTGVSTLTGYLQQPPFAPLILTVMVNQYIQPQAQWRQSQQALLISMNRLQSCLP